MKYFLHHFMLIYIIKETDSLHEITNNIFDFQRGMPCHGLLANSEYATG